MPAPATNSAWVMLAIASGACAAFNGVFAKLTTTELTTTWSSSIAQVFGLSASNKIVEYAIRGLFFGCNLLFNAIMWGLFTRALTLSSSTVRVSIINTSANFIITAVLSSIVFNESLPGQWWLGAAMLVTGSVIIGMREETEKKPVLSTNGAIKNDEKEEVDDSVELRSMKTTDTSVRLRNVRDTDGGIGDKDPVLK